MASEYKFFSNTIFIEFKYMKISNTPPYVVMKSTKEVIFYISKNAAAEKDISSWMKRLKLTDYKGMIINSKCIFKRLKDQECN